VCTSSCHKRGQATSMEAQVGNSTGFVFKTSNLLRASLLSNNPNLTRPPNTPPFKSKIKVTNISNTKMIAAIFLILITLLGKSSAADAPQNGLLT
jgi:hypothetical protein